MHRVASVSRGGDREETSKPWQPGEPFALNLPRPCVTPCCAKDGTPVKLHADDFEVEESSRRRRSATVFAIDLSLSMAMRSNLVRRRRWCSPSRHSFARSSHAISSPSSASERRPRNSKIEDVPGSHHRLRPTAPISSTPWPSVVTSCATNEVSVRSVVTDGEPTAHLRRQR